MSRLEVYRRVDQRWAWRLLASNGQVIATDGGQGYENEEDAHSMAEAIVLLGAHKTAEVTPLSKYDGGVYIQEQVGHNEIRVRDTDGERPGPTDMVIARIDPGDGKIGLQR